jgi:hypothetical protein
MPVLPFITVLLGLQIAVLHGLSLYFYLYWRYLWMDMIMHVLGGCFLVFVLAVAQRFRILPQFVLTPPALIIITALVFLVWELFGIYLTGGIKANFIIDTVSDTLFGILGVVIGYWLLKYL